MTNDSHFRTWVMVLWVVNFLARLTLSRALSGGALTATAKVLNFPLVMLRPASPLMGYGLLAVISLVWSYAICALWRSFQNR